jgi:membrane-bound metal-dependent hydrolase YbcI (DUF457 family)
MEPLMHFIIPLLVLLAIYPKIDKKLVMGLALLTLVPDIDYFISFTHRYLFHNIFFPIVMTLIIYFFSKNIKTSLISFYYLMSHLILDFATGAVALFWPIYQKLIEIEISLTTGLFFTFKITTLPLKAIKEHMVSKPSYFFTETGILVAFVLAIILIIKYKFKK